MIIDPYLYILLQAIAVITFIIILFLIIIVTMRFVRSLNQKRYSILSKKWEIYFLDYLNGDISLDKAISLLYLKNKYHWFWIFIEPFLETLSGNDFDKTKTLCREVGLINYYKKQLKAGRKNKKADAAKVLGSLKCSESIEDMLRLLHSNNSFLILAAAQGLAASGKHDTFEAVTKVLLENTYFTYEGATATLAGYGSSVCSHIIAILNHFISEGCHQNISELCNLDEQHGTHAIPSSVYNSILVDLIGHFRCRDALPVLDQLLQKADYETTVHIFKAFTRIGSVTKNFNVTPYLNHKYWVIRSFASQVWPLTDDQSAYKIMVNLLNDHHWWVRFHAAKALFSKGDKGKNLLKKQAREGLGAPSDISRYILSREGAIG